MSDAVRDIFADWRLPIGLTVAIVLTAIVYLRGWIALRKTRRAQFTTERLASFLGGLALLWIVVGSPMDGFADALLTAHMIEHLLLMSAIPMLLLYGLPVVALLRGVPGFFLRWVVGPLVRVRAVRGLAEWMVKPAVAWLALNVGYLAWHVPAAYNYALENETVHDLEHLCFLFTALLFWWYIMRPWPAKPRPDDWGMLVYLALGDVVMTLLSAFLAFCERPVYSYYVNHPNPFHIPVLEDQVLGAVVMWVLGSFAYLVPAMVITFRLAGWSDRGSLTAPVELPRAVR
ncbi:MAG: cytochrome c oxidase assembly protein [Acidobacteriaceae bacterium]